ncbi:DUF3943 domain-containing protein [Anaeromyxobacter dehalogenans]|uniref:DUF3943 domain-containing protein n=1 Tax=Anaeromyxobacter dehalogenans TaxID=161493 RepID=UPI00031D5628|nr:DUF3943 domain-containing protein [Anaeromyxobacter dehalogenans]
MPARRVLIAAACLALSWPQPHDAADPRSPPPAAEDEVAAASAPAAPLRAVAPDAPAATAATLPASVLPPPALSPRPSPHPLPPGANVFLPAAESAAVTLAMMGWNRWVGEAPWADITGDSIGRNLRSAWVLDDDQFWINQFGHPYQGMWSMTAARSAGLGFWGSTPYTIASSLVWEIAGETEPPSINDQITTPIGGIVLGEVLFRLAGILRGDGRNPWRELGAGLLAPMDALNHGLLHDGHDELDEPRAWTLSAGPVAARLAWDAAGPPPGWETSPEVAFRMVHGLAWHPAFRFERPFDHFELEAAYAGRSNPDATLILRGLLAGATYGDPAGWRGVYGLYGSFDLDTPGVFRVSTSALGLGTSGGRLLAHDVRVEGTAIVSGILIGGGGQVARDAEGKGRDYRLGPGGQSVLELQLTAAERATVRLGLRHYLLFGAGTIGGDELIGAGDAAVVVRIAGEHGVGIEGTLHTRTLWPETGGREAFTGRSVRVFWEMNGFHAPPEPLDPALLTQ